MAPKLLDQLNMMFPGEPWPEWTGWLVDTKGEQTRPWVTRIEVEKPLLDGSDWKVTLWSFFGGVNHRVTGKGSSGAEAQVAAAQLMEREYVRFLDRHSRVDVPI